MYVFAVYSVELVVGDRGKAVEKSSFCAVYLDQIDKHTLEIAQADEEVYTNLQDLADELPDHSPRFVLLSYPLTLVRESRSY